MKLEDFDNEIDALLKEDDVLAKAVINLQKRRERISNEEKNNKENESASISAESLPLVSGDGATDDTAIDDSYNFSATVEASDEDDFDLSAIQAEALAIDLADVISTADTAEALFSSDIKSEKRKLLGTNKTAATEPVKLLDFVINENEEESEEEDDEQNEVASEANDIHEDNIEAAKDTQEDGKELTPDVLADGQSEPNEETVIYENDAKTESYDSADVVESFDSTDEITSIESDNTPTVLTYDESGVAIEIAEDAIADIPTSYNDADSVFLPQFETPSPETEETTDEEAALSDTASEVGDEESGGENVEFYDSSDCQYTPDENYDTASTTQQKVRFIDGVFDFIELFIFSLAAVLLITTFFFRHSVVEGGSMEQTLFDGEHIIISKLFYTPERGDIIVCEDYTTDLRKPIVKRIIAVPGDTVIFYNDGINCKVYINGEELDEDYIFLDGLDFTPSGVWTIGENEVFVMGDHRNNSKDSREIGPVRIDSIIGKVLIRFYPFEKFGKVE